MAVFLAIGGLVFGIVRGSVFAQVPAGAVKEQRISDVAALIPQAEGAEIDSAALTPASAPFLASVNAGTQNPSPTEDTDVLYGEGALRDSGQIQKTKTSTALAVAGGSTPTSSVIYQIKTGDTLRSLSSSFGIPMNTIVQFNPSVNFSALVPGVSIVIPGQNDLSLLSGQS